VTPERAIVHDEVDEVELPGEDGYIGVLPGHAPLLAALKTGEMWYRKGTDRKFAFIAGGFAEIVADRVSILAQVAERAEDIDHARAEAARRRAEERISRPTSEIDAERARIALLRALTRLQVSTRQPRRRG
jgi:F-type H+-transporting ATPase subunit epsilon